MKNSIPNDVSITSDFGSLVRIPEPKDIGEITLTTSAKLLEEVLADMPEGEFRPYSWYDAESDTVTSYFADEDYYVKVLNEDIELFLDFEKHNVVGCRIIGVKNLMRPT